MQDYELKEKLLDKDWADLEEIFRSVQALPKKDAALVYKAVCLAFYFAEGNRYWRHVLDGIESRLLSISEGKG